MTKGYIFDYGGTLDTGGRHWGKVLWQAYVRCGVPVTEEQFRSAYVYAERTLGSKPLIRRNDTFRTQVQGFGRSEAQRAVQAEKADLTHRDYNDIIYMKGKMSDRDVRLWYVAHDKNIPNLIDKTKPIEDQARQACDLRNQYRYQARELMVDQEKRKKLDITDPIKSFDELMQHKMKDKGLSYEEALTDIVKTATKTRKSVNDELGVEG